MVAEVKFKQKDNIDRHIQATIVEEAPPMRREEEGFYSSCGQAFIRIN